METSAAIYVRRSAMDDREGDNRSLAGQERECREWAEREGLTVGPVYREAVGTSASRFSTKGRPQMERALAEMGTNFKTLIVWAFDRKPCQYLGVFNRAGQWLMAVVMLIMFVSCMSAVLGGGSNSPSSYYGDLDAYERGD